MRGGLAPSTLKSYDAAWNRYAAFCSSVPVPPCPVDISVLCAFISECAVAKDMQYSSISVFVAGIQFHARCLDPSAGSLFFNPSVRLLLNGIKRSKPGRRDSRLPLSTASLYSMVRTLRRGRFGILLDKMLETVLLVSFFGFLRIGEFSSASATFDPNRDLRIADVTFSDASLSITLRRSKTDREGNGLAVTIARTNSEFCPFASMSSYLGSRTAVSADEPLFVTGTNVPMSKAWFAARFRLLCIWCGLDAKRYTPHSLRIGGTTAMAKFVSPTTLKSMGRWSSSAFERYVRPSAADSISAQLRLSSVAGRHFSR